MTGLRVVVVNGSPNLESKTVGLVNVITNTLSSMVDVEVRQIDVYRLGADFSSATNREELSSSAEEAILAVETADILIAASPVFRGSYSGMFKHFFDLVDQYSLANKLVVLAATGGSERHALMLEHEMRPLFGFFQAHTAPVAFYASSADFDGQIILNPEVYGRIELGLRDIADLIQLRLTVATEAEAQAA